MNGVCPKNFGLCFMIWKYMPTEQPSPNPADQTKLFANDKSSNAHQNRQNKYKSYQKMLRQFMRVSFIRIKVSRSQNSLYKSATTSSAAGR
jgi:hypothetical protein